MVLVPRVAVYTIHYYLNSALSSESADANRQLEKLTLKNMHGNATLRPVWHTFRVDASFDKQRGITGIGLILRATNKPGRDGAVLARFSEAYIGLPVQAGEQFAVLRALEIASERGYRLLRADAKTTTH